MLRRRSPSRAGRSSRIRQWIIPTIGAVTPVALIVVNIAAFIVHHLSEFRFVITVLAFVSGMMLNSWMGLSIYRWLKLRRRDHPLFDESNQDILLISGMGVIIIISAITAWGCYAGLSNEKDLPNAPTFIIGIVAILGPMLIQRFFQRAAHDEERRLARPTGLPSGSPPAPPLARSGGEQHR